MKILLMISALLFSAGTFAAEPPAQLERESYRTWLESVDSAISPYFDHLYDWYEEQQGATLPGPVFADPDFLYVTVDRAIQQTIEAEDMGDVEKGTTYGFETYGVIHAPVETVMETILFRWGKPVGARNGVTYPVDSVFSYREERFDPFWGEGNFRNMTTLRGGGVAKDQHDVSSLLVRGNPRDGYVLMSQFLAPHGKTPSTSSMSIMMLKPTADGRTDFRISGRYTGQSYLIFGIEYGRRNFGFNLSRIRSGQKDFFDMVGELKRTGRITERRPK